MSRHRKTTGLLLFCKNAYVITSPFTLILTRLSEKDIKKKENLDNKAFATVDIYTMSSCDVISICDFLQKYTQKGCYFAIKNANVLIQEQKER